MKKLLLLFPLLTLFFNLNAQNFPQGIAYQGFAIDEQGSVITDETITIKIEMFHFSEGRKEIDYSEYNTVTTSRTGSFYIIIGDGYDYEGEFNFIPWDKEQMWTSIYIKGDDNVYYEGVSTQLLSVPYAYSALTAQSLSQDNESKDIPQFWRLNGNWETSDKVHYLGTNDGADLVIKTNQKERMRVSSEGMVHIINSRFDIVDALQLTVHDTLRIKNSGFFEVQSASKFDSVVDFNDQANFYSKTYMDKKLWLNDELYTQKNAIFKDTVTMEGGTVMKGKTSINYLEVQDTTLLNGKFITNGSATFNNRSLMNDQLEVKSHLTVDGQARVNNKLLVKDDISDGGYIAVFENTNSGNGDGIKIRLGKTRPVNPSDDIPIFLGPLENVTDNMKIVLKEIMMGEVDDLLNAYIDFVNPIDVIDNQLLFFAAQCNFVQSIANSIIVEINEGLGLPFTDRDILVAINTYDPNDENDPDNCGDPIGCNFGDALIDDDWITDLDNDQEAIIPAIPSIGICNEIFPNFELPSFPDLSENPNSLSTENVFIQFADKNDQRVGAITGINRAEYFDQTLDAFYVLDVSAELVGLDPLQMIVQGGNQVSILSKDFNDLGVQYTSGHGDYAEWLQRIDPTEVISSGDIVAVKAGKITKDLTDAEQIMVISYKPIVLGNVPNKGEAHLGNNVAFMGQVPVKVTGPVTTGDYIVASRDIPGYGVAYSESEMTIDLLKLTVGRSWDTNTSNGPKLVNTVVGVPHDVYVNIIENLENTLDSTQKGLHNLESRLNNIEKLLDGSPSF